MAETTPYLVAASPVHTAESAASASANIPDGVLPGDILVLFGLRRGAIDGPEGWSDAGPPPDPLSGAGFDQWTFAYWKEADGTEGGDSVTVSFSDGSSSRISANVAVIRHESGKVDVQTLPAQRAPTGPSASTPLRNLSPYGDSLVMVAFSWIYSSTSGQTFISGWPEYAEPLQPTTMSNPDQLRNMAFFVEAGPGEHVSIEYDTDASNDDDSRSSVWLAFRAGDDYYDARFSPSGSGRDGTIQTWQPPSPGRYRITACGAQGGGENGGLGAVVSGTFELEVGQPINLLVGQQGASASSAAGGGGGSYVVTAQNEPLLVAGGGGGRNNLTSGNGANADAVIGTDGNDGAGGGTGGFGAGGVNGGGGGGYHGTQDRMGHGGAGFYGDGSSDTTLAFVNGGTGGTDTVVGTGVDGGFGGGGNTQQTTNFGLAGGGGGYSGGGGGYGSSSSNLGVGGGGGSFLSGEAESGVAGLWRGSGEITISLLEAAQLLDAEPSWDHATDTYTLGVEWGEIGGATGYRLALYQGETLLEEIDTAGLEHAFTGLDAETTFLLVLTPYDAEGDLDPMELTVETPMGLPGIVTNIQHSFTTDSLTYTWDEVEGADDYLLTLTRDGDPVDEKDTGDLEATFSELEDGTAYTLEIRGRRGPGEGDSILYEADTGFLPPDAPTGFHEVSRRIIAVEPGWELAEPEKVREVRIQVLLGDEILYDEVKDEATTSRLFPVPMASTDYLVRVRAGNPGGWGDWLEGTASTLVYPLLDTRLGVIGAAYQEALLYPDTWDGGTDAEGHGAAEDAFLKVQVSKPSALPMKVDSDAISIDRLRLNMGDFFARLSRQDASASESDSIRFSVSFNEFFLVKNSVDADFFESVDVFPGVTSATFKVVSVPHSNFQDDLGSISLEIDMGSLTLHKEG